MKVDLQFPHSARVQVFIDDKPCNLAVALDTKEGWADVWETDENNRRLGNETKRVYGKIRVEFEPNMNVVIAYTNYRGEHSIRTIYPIRTKFASSPDHPEAQWLLDAYCFERGALRTFAMKDIHLWRPAS